MVFRCRRHSICRLILLIFALLSCAFIFILQLQTDESHDFQKTQSIKLQIENKFTVESSAERPISLQEPIQSALKNSSYILPVTAVIISWKRLENIESILLHLSKYPFIKEVLIWNNNPALVLNRSCLLPSSSDHSSSTAAFDLKIFNGGTNLHDMAKYVTGALATYDHCYFQDDDWQNVYLDAMYTNFQLHPHLIHSNTLPIIHLEQQRWRFFDQSIQLHSGFTWFGTGAFIPKDLIIHYLRQVATIIIFSFARFHLNDSMK